MAVLTEDQIIGRQEITSPAGVKGVLEFGPTKPDGTRFERFTPSSTKPVTIMDSGAARIETIENINKLNRLLTPPPPPETKPTTDTNSLTPDEISAVENDANPEEKRIRDSLTEIDTQIDSFTGQIDTLRTELNTALQGQIQSIKNLYTQRKEQMKDINKRLLGQLSTIGYRTDSFKYGGAMFGGIVSAAESQGVQRLAELDAEESSLIASAQQAYQSKDWELLSQKMNLIEKQREVKQKELENIQKLAIDKNKTLLEDLNFNSKKSELIAPYLVNFLTGDEETDTALIDKVAEAQGIPAIILAGELSKHKASKEKESLTEEIKEFSFENAQRVKQGLKPYKTLQEYRGAIERQKKEIEGLGGGSSGDPIRDARTIFEGGGLGINDLPTKGNYRSLVQAELNKLRTEALKTNDVFGIMRASAGGKDVADTFIQAFDKALNVVYQISDLQEAINGESTGPIWGIIRSNNPYDVKAQQLQAQIAAIVPNLARGVYGEVGVLTDNDIKNYSKTLPKLTNLEEARNAILGITIKSVQRSLENKIKSQAAANRDVSGYADIYRSVQELADQTLESVGLPTENKEETKVGKETIPQNVINEAETKGYSLEELTEAVNEKGLDEIMRFLEIEQ